MKTVVIFLALIASAAMPAWAQIPVTVHPN